MQLRLDAADRLVELVEERRGPVPVDQAARKVLKLGQAVPVGLARSLLDEAVLADPRLRRAGDPVSPAAPPAGCLGGNRPISARSRTASSPTPGRATGRCRTPRRRPKSSCG